VTKVLRGCLVGGLAWTPELVAVAGMTVSLLYAPGNLHAGIMASAAAKRKITEQLLAAGVSGTRGARP
jgi:hypothetical protein